MQLIEQGEQGIRDTIREARNLGIVMDEDVLDKAEELDRKFNQVSNTVGTALKTAIVEASAALGEFINAFNNFMTTAGGGTVGAGANQPLSDQLTPEQRNEMRLRLALGNKPGENLYEGFNFGDDGNIVVAPPPPPTVTPPGGGGGGGSRSSAVDDIETQRKAVEALIAGLEFERSLIGLSAGMSAVQGITDALQDGKITAEEFGAILSNVLAQAGNFFLQTGFNLIGASLGIPGFAMGTANTGGSRGEVRGVVHGQEAVVPLPNGGKIPVQISGASTHPQGVEVFVTLGWSQDSNGNIAPIGEKVSQRTVAAALPVAMNATRKQAAKDAPGAVAKYQRDQGGSDFRTM